MTRAMPTDLRIVLLTLTFLVPIRADEGEKPVQRTSVCFLQENAERFLNSKVEVEALIFAGVEYPRITEGRCSFRFARGDDYQTFGACFTAKHDGQWKMLEKLLSVSECASNVRVAKARLKGTVVRVPATGTRSPDDMPLELVIQSVSRAEHVPVKCTPPDARP